MASNERLDFGGGDPDRDADQELFVGFFLPFAGYRNNNYCTNFVHNSKKLSTNCCEIFEGVRCLTSSKPFDSGTDPNIVIRTQEFLAEVLPLRDWGNKEFCTQYIQYNYIHTIRI